MDRGITELANLMDATAAETIAWNNKHWGRGSEDGYDADMIAAGKADAADHRRIGTLLRKGKFTEAAKFADGMDTFPREHIPDKVWDFLQTFRR